MNVFELATLRVGMSLFVFVTHSGSNWFYHVTVLSERIFDPRIYIKLI